MSIAFYQQSFLANALSSTLKPTNKNRNKLVIPLNDRPISSVYQSDDPKDSSRKNENQLAKLAIVTLAAGVLTLGSVDPASAAKTGGRVGGQAFRSSAPQSSLPRINNSRTNVYVNPPVAPPLIGGYGYGFGVPYYGGWGWSPFSFFAPGPGVAIGVGGGFDTLVLFLFLGAVAAVIRRFFGSREEEDDY
ncbi:uncharacterized protein LOC127794547 isoform X1 [Diospyros lotus]|uniref:uncharacterized protein LOC127794547 isoform X1 n=1 Tax=Diospyros lotus TaxID=55363 RepID=UPI00225BBBA2|nr:uncharacterized protein LOC127794547 isoform X1 [Diospyros lotus]